MKSTKNEHKSFIFKGPHPRLPFTHNDNLVVKLIRNQLNDTTALCSFSMIVCIENAGTASQSQMTNIFSILYQNPPFSVL